jgi:hypothetical protein
MDPSSTKLTADQLYRIEQNKKKAQELRKRKQPTKPSGAVKKPPLPKPSTHSSDYPDSPQFGTSYFSHSHPKHPSHSAPSQSASASHYGGNRAYKVPTTSHQNFKSPSLVTDTACHANSASAFSSTKHTNSSHEQFVKLKDTITANFITLSRTRFKVQMAYDSGVIEIFKRMKTRSYGEVVYLLEIGDGVM